GMSESVYLCVCTWGISDTFSVLGYISLLSSIDLKVVATTILLERRLPKCIWPRIGIHGANFGLGNNWYLRVEDRNESATQRARRYVKHFHLAAVSGPEKQKEGEAFRDPSPRREKLEGPVPGQGWEIVRRTAMSQVLGERHEHIYHV
ncbi:hypothetical protein scyTo_0020295, partial [Scyliorhinus torazame]|nr:hypothetical protein [Scyliorhinus torazame]